MKEYLLAEILRINHRDMCVKYFYMRRIINIFTANIAENERVYIPAD
jgi:hypothetical protein